MRFSLRKVPSIGAISTWATHRHGNQGKLRAPVPKLRGGAPLAAQRPMYLIDHRYKSVGGSA